MLVIGRKLEESFSIGKDITVTVVQIQPGYVRLGITAPRNIAIARDDMKTGRDGRKAGRQGGNR